MAPLGDKLSEQLVAAIEKARTKVENQRERFGDAFDKLADKALQAFDAKTERLVKVITDQLDEAIKAINKMTAETETAAETELRLISERRESEDTAKRLADAEKTLFDARVSGDPQAIIDAEQALFRTREDIHIKHLEEQAAIQRKGLEAEAAETIRAVEEAARLDVQNKTQQRENLRAAFETRLEILKKGLSKQGAEFNKSMRSFRKLLKKHGVNFATAGADLGMAFVKALRAALAAAAGASGNIGALIRRIANQIKIPSMAEGGIVTRPTLALIGEAGPEAVIPLSRAGRARGGGVTELHVHFEGPVGSGEQFARQLRDELVRQGRRNPDIFGGFG